MCRKSQEISSPHLKPFPVESRKTSRGGRFGPPPPPVPSTSNRVKTGAVHVDRPAALGSVGSVGSSWDAPKREAEGGGGGASLATAVTLGIRHHQVLSQLKTKPRAEGDQFPSGHLSLISSECQLSRYGTLFSGKRDSDAKRRAISRLPPWKVKRMVQMTIQWQLLNAGSQIAIIQTTQTRRKTAGQTVSALRRCWTHASTGWTETRTKKQLQIFTSHKTYHRHATFKSQILGAGRGITSPRHLTGFGTLTCVEKMLKGILTSASSTRGNYSHTSLTQFLHNNLKHP